MANTIGKLMWSKSMIVPSEGDFGGFKVNEVEGANGVQENL